MIKVKVTTSNPDVADLFLRQTPSRAGFWDNCEFYINKHIEECDWWIICHGSSLTNEISQICDPDHVIFFSMEPFEIATPRKFFEQFSSVVLTDERINHPKVIMNNVLTWWAGIEVRFDNGHKILPNINHDYDSFKIMDIPKKYDRISVVTSTHNHLPGHLKRLEFIRKLRKHPISEHIDFFGGGHRPILDKLEALLPYKYHLALENCSIPYYWSEKLADPFLAFCLPIYYGCTNIEDYFPIKSLLRIDIDDFDATIDTLESAISGDIYSNHQRHIIEARDLVLGRYNIFQLMANICSSKAHRFMRCTIKPAASFQLIHRRIAGRVYRQIHDKFNV